MLHMQTVEPVVRVTSTPSVVAYPQQYEME